MTMAILIREKFPLGLPSRYNTFRGLVHYLQGGVQAGVVLEKELRVLYLDPQATEATV